ncbi:hypothetical protein [Rhodococcus aetherivorans]|uniref:hypothetical protein n=1 Tax=Rhodococcus aetherivorans TaxID=191292 RepID=UPI000B1A4073|nr:hypothetical protein [Rhodococcus aetherivorans]
MTGGGQRLDLVLDGGRVGLRFFAEHLPRAERCAPGLPSCAQLRERYDEQRGTDPAVLLADADVFARLEGALGAEVARQRSYVDALAAAWTGGGAVGAADALDRHVAVGEDLQARLGAARRALTDAAAAVLAIVEEKSRAAAEFADTTVGGRTVEEIDAILAGAAGGDGPTTAQLAAWDSALGPAPNARLSRNGAGGGATRCSGPGWRRPSSRSSTCATTPTERCGRYSPNSPRRWRRRIPARGAWLR